MIAKPPAIAELLRKLAQAQPRQIPSPTHERETDRAEIVTATILRIINRVLSEWVDRDPADFAAARAEVEELLRSEFLDVTRRGRS
jgi:hypothetical protein